MMTKVSCGDLLQGHLLAEISLWSADLVRMADDIARVEPYADIYHIDASDGHFSPAFLLFPDQVAAIRKLTKKPLHVHLMVQDAVLLTQIEQFAEAGADIISVHAENKNAQEAIELISNKGLAAGVVLKLESDVALSLPYLGSISILTLLGTRIGVKGQSLDGQATNRLQQARQHITASGRNIVLAADGGIRDNTVSPLYESGADTIVMGSLCFGASDLAQRMNWVHGHNGRA